jgi:hypothetical protein
VSFYLDARVIVPTLVSEPTSASVQGFLRSTTDPLLVADFTEGEVASAISRLVRTAKLTSAQGAAALADFDRWRLIEAQPLEIEPGDVRDAIALVRRFELKLRTPDALHVAIAVRASATLVTFDGGLALAAQAIGLPVMTP